nr:immunoglobulin heavy chain junction region [Mus musculus]
ITVQDLAVVAPLT